MFYLLQYTVLYVGSFDIFLKLFLFSGRVRSPPRPEILLLCTIFGTCVCKYDTNIGAHCRGLGCSIFIEINVKRQSNPSPPSKCSTFYTAQHIFSQAQLFQNIISKSVCLLGTTAGG